MVFVTTKYLKSPLISYLNAPLSIFLGKHFHTIWNMYDAPLGLVSSWMQVLVEMHSFKHQTKKPPCTTNIGVASFSNNNHLTSFATSPFFSLYTKRCTLKNSKATNQTTMHFIMLTPQPKKLGDGQLVSTPQ